MDKNETWRVFVMVPHKHIVNNASSYWRAHALGVQAMIHEECHADEVVVAMVDGPAYDLTGSERRL